MTTAPVRKLNSFMRRERAKDFMIEGHVSLGPSCGYSPGDSRGFGAHCADEEEAGWTDMGDEAAGTPTQPSSSFTTRRRPLRSPRPLSVDLTRTKRAKRAAASPAATGRMVGIEIEGIHLDGARREGGTWWSLIRVPRHLEQALVRPTINRAERLQISFGLGALPMGRRLTKGICSGLFLKEPTVVGTSAPPRTQGIKSRGMVYARVEVFDFQAEPFRGRKQLKPRLISVDETHYTRKDTRFRLRMSRVFFHIFVLCGPSPGIRPLVGGYVGRAPVGTHPNFLATCKDDIRVIRPEDPKRQYRVFNSHGQMYLLLEYG
ncbi:hypothetical protein M407DRAFT_236509 [Tulasnella calospora MUT 4182]|uniref:Uncharacterized protein n=1 Tax=Tulasnella calospora MUT 4182 TaxID=1051891 RepID=A0A0C3Q7Y6_9AGAM|nr:hypothetical protein M407DRAFT_236509 [Tulasnella calospora MUT 4182]